MTMKPGGGYRPLRTSTIMEPVPSASLVQDDRPADVFARWVPGVAIVAAIAAVATVIGHFLPVLGAPVAGILLGAVLAHPVRSHRTHDRFLQAGMKFCQSRLLQAAVVLLGAQLSVTEMAKAGWSSLPVMLGTLAVCLIAAYLIGRALGIDTDIRTLIGVGTAICGASAIAAVSPVIRARGAAIAYAVSTIFCFNVAAVLLFPPIGHLLGMGQEAFGVFAGTAVNDTSSVVAAATTYGDTATSTAVVVKLTRTLMIIPITLALGALAARRSRVPGEEAKVGRLVPWFLVGFVVVVVVNSAGWIPDGIHPAIAWVALFFITMALAAIGLSIDAGVLKRAGLRPLLLGGILWILVATSSLLLQWGTM